MVTTALTAMVPDRLKMTSRSHHPYGNQTANDGDKCKARREAGRED